MLRFCTKCGAALSENDPFCGKCGSPVQGLLAQPALSVGQPQAAVHAPTLAPSLQRPNMVAQAASAPPNSEPLAPSSHTRLSVFRMLLTWAIYGAALLSMAFMLNSYHQFVKECIAKDPNQWPTATLSPRTPTNGRRRRFPQAHYTSRPSSSVRMGC